MIQTSKDEECLKLAVDGQNFLAKKDLINGIEYLERALAIKTSNLNVLSSIYSQLGNAYFSSRSFVKALEFHNNYLLVSRIMNDRESEAKACGSLGATLKALNGYNDAITFLERQLDIAREMQDKKLETRALYNLGMCYQLRGKHLCRQLKATNLDMSMFSMNTSVLKPFTADLEKSVEHFTCNLVIAEELSDESMCGRVYGHLGNTYYLLRDYGTAIDHHYKCLEISRRLGDKRAQRRSYICLGNAYVYLPNVEKAIEYYRLALTLAYELRDRLAEAHCCYSLANAAALLPDYQTATEFHTRHLEIARSCEDKAGEARAYLCLGDDYKHLEQFPRAAYFYARNRKAAKALGDVAMALTATESLRALLNHGLIETVEGEISLDSSADPEALHLRLSSSLRSLNDNGSSMDLSAHTMNRSDGSSSRASTESKIPKGGKQYTQDEFFEMISKMQGDRLDDQRCPAPVLRDNTALSNNSANLSDLSYKKDPFNISPRADKSSERRRSFIRRLKNFNPLSTSTPMIGRFSSLSSLKGSGFRSRKGSRTNSPGRHSLVSLSEEGNQGPVPFMDLSAVSAIHNDISGEGVFRVPDLPSKKTTQSAACLIMNENIDNHSHKHDNKENNHNGEMQNRTRTPKAPPRKRTVLGGADSLIDILISSNSRRLEDQRAVLPGLSDVSLLKNIVGDKKSAGDCDHKLDAHLIDMVKGGKEMKERIEEGQKEARHAATLPEDDIGLLVTHMQKGHIDDQRISLK